MVNIFVYDVRATYPRPGSGKTLALPVNPPISYVDGKPIQSIKIIAEASDPITYIALKILWMLPEGEKIQTLYLCGHGYAGGMNLGLGLDQLNAWELGDLNGHFDSYLSEIQLHACGVASDRSAGYMLCRAIANATGVIVTAAVYDQDPDALFLFEGPTVSAGPSS